jgi:DNA-binding NtrC family response regulator
VAATARNLGSDAAAGRFRADLLQRLSGVELNVPALRDRRDDIPYLTAALVHEFAQKFGKTIDGVTPAAERILMGRAWPGNVGELRNVLERACMLAECSMLTDRDVAATMPVPRDGPGAGAAQALETIERDHITRVLEEVRGNKLVAARRLGISRRTLYRRLERHGLYGSIH